MQIDHVVALSDAWQKGAQQLSADRRKQLANDPYNLLAVDSPSNQRKSDGDAATWLPANKSFRCSSTFVARQIGVKAKYSLWVTQTEHDAMSRVLSSCPAQTVPTGDGAESVVPQEDVSQGSSSQDGSSGEQSESSTVVEPPLHLTATVPMSTTRTAPRCVQPAKRRYTKGSPATRPNSIATATASPADSAPSPSRESPIRSRRNGTFAAG